VSSALKPKLKAVAQPEYDLCHRTDSAVESIRCSLRYAHTPMQLTIQLPDDLFDDVKDKLASQPSGVLETVALDAILAFLDALRDGGSSNQRAE